MDDRIVVGYDTSPESVSAVRWAAGHAAYRGWTLEVVHVWGFAGREGGGAGDSWLGREVQEQVHRVAAEGAAIAVEAAPGVDARPVVLHGPPARVLVERAQGARSVVVGRRGAGLVNALVGSSATGVLHRARCPVVVVPAGAPAPAAARGPVVVGFDGSAGSSCALEAAFDQARVLGTDLCVVTAWTAAVETSSAPYWALGYPSQAPGDVAFQEAERMLDTARAWAATRRDVEVSFDAAPGRPSQVLVRRSRHASLVVVGTRGRGGFASLVLGSTSRAVVQRASSPVLVTRSGQTVLDQPPHRREPAAAGV